MTGAGDSSGGPAGSGRLRRLREELDELGLELGDRSPWTEPVLEELDYALRPVVHERRIPSYGAFVEPHGEPASWSGLTRLEVVSRTAGEAEAAIVRRFADGLSSFLLRAGDHTELVVFDRPAGSERDLVILAAASGATTVQRHPSGVVRAVGDFGVLRWDGMSWHHEPPTASWIEAMTVECGDGDHRVLSELLEFAVHDLGARGIGALLLHHPDEGSPAMLEQRLPVPPPLRITRPADLAPLRHVLGQVDGAAVFDRDGTLCRLGVRLVPSPTAESDVEGYRGMRHTAGRRYSFDDPRATVIVVSEDGPVSVLRAGELVGRSEPT